MLHLPNCNVVTEDEVHAVEDHATVVIVGEPPNCTVRFSAPDMVARKFVTVDRLTGASWTRAGDTWTVTGRSDYVAEAVNAEDSQLTLQVTPEPGCEECNK